VLKHLSSASLLASSNAPIFNTFGGRVARPFLLTMTATNGSIYYTTNGADPRVPFLNTVSAEARRYEPGNPIRLEQNVLIKARSLAGTNWSALTEAAFQAGQPIPSLRIVKIIDNSDDYANGQFPSQPETMGLRLGVVDATGQVTLRLVNPPAGTTLVLQTSTNLEDWISIRTNSVPSSLLEKGDETGGPSSARFYRMIGIP